VKDALSEMVHLKDYRESEFFIDKTELCFELGDAFTVVTSNLHIRRNPKSSNYVVSPLVLDGSLDLDLVSISIDSISLSETAFSLKDGGLVIFEPSEQFVLQTVVNIKPQDNTALTGLYRSRDMFCSQCEAEGFRHITYYLDRPDVMSIFLTKIIADKKSYPVMLSNGNPINREDLDNGTHSITWQDPFPKPSYLFALVAGKLSYIEDRFVTSSNRSVSLQIYVEEKDLGKCGHAMSSLKKSMKWDEITYGREYDLDIFMIVAVDDFNMGAMENKGLNIFNTSAVLADPKITTDSSFQNIEAIVAHEYFHNWSGNRVTCRDWFQLSLKEGFTVFRDAQFSADMNSPTVKRIQDVSFLRSHQFVEDAGTMSHPVQPNSYLEINNFYTVTIYEKGAEIVGMLHSLLGAEHFRSATDLYFERHDGQAVTIEDFVRAMEDISGIDLEQFRLWYTQAGTPVVSVTSDYSENSQKYILTFEQSCPDTPQQFDKKPFLVPIRLGLLNADGESFGLNADGDNEIMFKLSDKKQSVAFENISSKPIPALLRGFSAPVKLNYHYSDEELALLAARDTDGLIRWDACQQLAFRVFREPSNLLGTDACPQEEILLTTYEKLLSEKDIDPALVALMLQIPEESLLHDKKNGVDPEAIHRRRESLRSSLAGKLRAKLEAAYHAHNIYQTYEPASSQIGVRSLKNAVLDYLMYTEVGVELAWRQFKESNNMTDQSSALRCLINCSRSAHYARIATDRFECQWKHETLAMNIWFQIQSASVQKNTLVRVEELLKHSLFNIRNPNKVRSVIGAFCGSNLVNFHKKDGTGYDFLENHIKILNEINPQIGARLVVPLTRWRRYMAPHSRLMRRALQRLSELPDLSKDISEVVLKSL